MSSKRIPRSTYDMQVDEPYDLSHRFRNLQNCLEFIENESIMNLKNGFQDKKFQIKKERQSRAQFSKAIYKKVISRDNQFDFKQKFTVIDTDAEIYDFNQKYLKSDSNDSHQNKKQKKNYQRKFKHGQIISLEQKRQRARQSKERQLTMRHIKMLETPEFDEHPDVQFYELLKGEADEKFQHTSNQIYNSEFQKYVQDNFKPYLVDDNAYYGKASSRYLFDSNRELMFWKIGKAFVETVKTQDQVIANCVFLQPENVKVANLLDFSSRNMEISDLMNFYKIKKALHNKMQLQKNNENLQEEYNRAKKKFEEMKQSKLKSKVQRLPTKFLNNVAQTNDEMQEKDFDEYFVQDAKDGFNRLKQLNEIRDRIVNEETGQPFRVMATNIGIEIGKQLFKLLMLVLKGESFSSSSQFVRTQNENQIEKKILQLIYTDFKNFRSLEVNGMKKIDIIKKYLQQRQKNERFYETYLHKANLNKSQGQKMSFRQKTAKK